MMPVETGAGAYVVNLGAVSVVGTLFGMPIEAFLRSDGGFGREKVVAGFDVWGRLGCLAVASMKQSGSDV